MKGLIYFVLLPLLLCGCSSSSNDKNMYADLIKDNDFEAAHLKLSHEAEELSYGGYTTRSHKSERYVNDYYYVLKAEAEFLLSQNDAEFERLYIERLSDFNPEEYVVCEKALTLGEFPTNKFNFSNEMYQKAIERYNTYCLSVIRKAILRNKAELAQQISVLIRPDLVYEQRTENGNTIYIWRQTNASRTEAANYLSGNN